MIEDFKKLFKEENLPEELKKGEINIDDIKSMTVVGDDGKIHEVDLSKKDDCKYTEYVVCPYCGHKHKDGWTIEEQGYEEAEISCDFCKKDFIFWLNVEVTYSSKKVKF